MAALERRRVKLCGGLQHVAAVGEQRRLVGQHDGQPGTAGKPGQPSQTLGPRRDILAEMLIGAGDEKAVNPALGEAGAQRCKFVSHLFPGTP